MNILRVNRDMWSALPIKGIHSMRGRHELRHDRVPLMVLVIMLVIVVVVAVVSVVQPRRLADPPILDRMRRSPSTLPAQARTQPRAVVDTAPALAVYRAPVAISRA